MMPEPPVTNRIRLIFICAVLLLAAQTIFIERYGEPYPALLMPGFHGAGAYNNGILRFGRSEVAFISDGQEFSFPLKRVLEDYPLGYHGDLAQNALRTNCPPPPTMTGRWARIRNAVFPGFATRCVPRDSPEKMESLQVWVRRRGNALLPGRKFSRVEFRSFVDTMPFDGAAKVTERQLIDTFVVPLEGAR